MLVKARRLAGPPHRSAIAVTVAGLAAIAVVHWAGEGGLLALAFPAPLLVRLVVAGLRPLPMALRLPL